MRRPLRIGALAGAALLGLVVAAHLYADARALDVRVPRTLGEIVRSVPDGLRSGVSGAAARPRPSAFTRVVVDPRPGRRTLEKALADIDGDRRLDVIIGTGNGVRWYRFPGSGNPKGNWGRHDILTSGDAYESMKVTDLNGDSRPDLVLSIGEKVVWLEHPGGDGTGSWGAHRIAGGTGHDMYLHDMDGDGRIDVVTSRTRNIDFQNGPTSWEVMGWGSGASGSPEDGLALLGIGRGKGRIDIVGANSGGIYWFENPRERGRDARTAGAWIAHRIGSNTTGGPALATMDVNGDGRMDVVQAPNEGAQGSQGLIWWQAPAKRGTGKWIPHTIDESWRTVHWIEIGDFNRDRHPDILLTEEEQSHDAEGDFHYDNDRVAILYGDGRGGFVTQVLERTGGQNQVAADVDRDGDLDFVTANHGVLGAPNPIELFINRLRG